MAGHNSNSRRVTQPTQRVRKRPRSVVREQAAGEEVPDLSSVVSHKLVIFLFTNNFKFPQNEVLDIWVGKAEGREKFTVHKAFICHYAPFLRAALDFHVIEDETPTIRYEDTTPEIFGRLINWIYTKSMKEPNTGELPQLRHMVRLWVLGDKVYCQGLQNAAIRGLYEGGWCGNYADMKYIYNNTSGSSLLRKLFVGQVSRHVPIKTLAGFLEKHMDESPPQMLADLVLALKRRLLKTDAKEHASIEDYLVVEIGDL